MAMASVSTKCRDNAQSKCHFEGFALIRDIFLMAYLRDFRHTTPTYVSKVKNWHFRSALVRYLLAKLLMKPVES